MRHINKYYCLAYSDSLGGSDENVVPPLSRIRITQTGERPANAFVDWHAFESSLSMQTYMRPGNSGRFTASHANACIGRMIEYQVQRRNRQYVPGVPGAWPGEPNDYINMFIEEMKVTETPSSSRDLVSQSLCAA